MFKLKRLEITGFKSFADYTEVVFTGNGITAVVGPNGCGKSNVSDAISWVLGEQSPKSLRGQEMKDVVFQGTGTRNPGGMAEVVLHLERDGEYLPSDESELEDIDEKLGLIDENMVDVDALEAEHLDTDEDQDLEAVSAEIEEGEAEVEGVEMVQAAQVGSIKTITTKAKRRWRPRSFALDFAPGEAVSITRRLYLSGESDYLLNNKSCRLRDIQDLFAGTGLSGAHYAIIEQGRIGQILSSKPSDRRSLIEEAAGISKFKTRQRAAESRLESAKTNLGRISDIVEEIEKRTRSLRRQANKTRRYKVLKEELRELQKKTYAIEYQRLNESISELNGKLETVRKKEKEIREFAEDKETAVKNATQAARTAEEFLTALRARHAENALERDRAEREKKYQDEQCGELKARVEDLKTEVKVTGARIEGLKSEISATESAAAEKTDAAKVERERLKEAEALYQEVLSRVNEIESRLDVQRADQLQHTAAVERLSEIGRQYEAELERTNERIKGLEIEKARAEETHQKRRQESKDLDKQLEIEHGKLEMSREEKREAIEECNKARLKLEKAEAELTVAVQEHSRNQHRLETLKELEETGAIYEPSVQKLLSAEKSLGVKLRGTLADRFKTDSESDRAVESLFGPYLQSVLVDSGDDAITVVKYLNKNGLGRIPVLVVGKSGGNRGAANPEIIKLLGIDGGFASVLAEVFPNEMSARVLKNVDSVNGSDPLAVTMDGDLVRAGKLFVSGSKDPSAKNKSLLEFKREMRELGVASADLLKTTEKARKDVENARSKLKKLEDGLVDLQSYVVQLERDLLSREIQSTAMVQEIDRSERHKKIVIDELSQLRKEAESIEQRRAEMMASVENAEKARIESGKKIERTMLDLAEARKVLDAENEAYNEKRTFAEVASERMRAAVSALDRVNAEKEELESRLQRQTDEIASTTERIAELENSSLELSRRLSLAEDEIKEESAELAAAVASLTKVRTKSDNMSVELAELNSRATEAREERAGVEIKQAEVKTRLQNVESNCTHDLGIELTELLAKVEFDDDFEFEEARDRVEYLRDRIENFGAINMLAVEELAETEERLEFLTLQRQDIVESIGSAEEALREIKRRSRERFKRAFHAINENFTVFFSELFGGGKGEMVLLESDDILEAGVEIIAQPPGKRLQNMLLLSGGEKAMTAIALVLAIFKYHPSPFCLLDEVDAPLDDANVSRFVDRIATMSEDTQFIVITHNKRTMEAAKALYGVTMQEAGVSKVVSVRFE